MLATLSALSENELRDIGRRIIAESGLAHVGFIVDGNRRWARQRSLPLTEGHRIAVEVILQRVADQVAMGLPVTSFWLFSTENWNRDSDHVNALFHMGAGAEDRVEAELRNLGLSFKHIGRKDRIPQELAQMLTRLEAEDRGDGRYLTIAAIDYGGRDELVRAFNVATSTGVTKLAWENVNSYLDTAGIPDPDLVIRTSGEMRTSGFMLWQAAHSEWLFPETSFPDFDLPHFISALQQFSKREKRLGR